MGSLAGELLTDRYDGGSLVSYLRKVKAWLDGNPNEGNSLISDLISSCHIPLHQP